jgi:hypothetical protein
MNTKAQVPYHWGGSDTIIGSPVKKEQKTESLSGH